MDKTLVQPWRDFDLAIGGNMDLWQAAWLMHEKNLQGVKVMKTPLSNWDKQVFMPLAMWQNLLTLVGHKESAVLNQWAQSLFFTGAWFADKIIIRLGENMREQLAKREIDSSTGAETFLLLPWGVYVETPSLIVLGKSVDGFFAALDQDIDTGARRLGIYFASDKAQSWLPMYVPLGIWSVADALKQAVDMEGKPYEPDKGLDFAINCLLHVVKKRFSINRPEKDWAKEVTYRDCCLDGEPATEVEAPRLQFAPVPMPKISPEMEPLQIITEFGKTYPDIWKLADQARAQKGDGLPEWDSAVFLPITAWIGILGIAQGKSNPTPEDVSLVQLLAAAGAWRPTQDIIRFDQDVFEALKDMKLTGTLPANILWQLPAWAIFVEAPVTVGGHPNKGFLAYLEEDAQTGQRELRLLFTGAHAYSAVVPLGAWDLQHALEMVNASAKFQGEEMGIELAQKDLLQADAGLVSAINLLIYICSYGLDDKEKKGVFEEPAKHPTGKKTKNGWRLFPPNKPTIHILGRDFGETIRKSREMPMAHEAGGNHASPRPHIRRAHWHSFWTGPRKGKRLLAIRWLPPIAVAMGEDGTEDES